MKFYRLFESDDPELKDKVYITAGHEWSLPGLICPVCNAWGGSGREFPCIEPSPEQREYLDLGGPQSLEWHREILPKSGLKLPDGSLPGPSAEFGASVGEIEDGHIVTDFVWPMPWTILIREHVKEKLTKSDLRLSGFREARIRGSAKFNEKFQEVQIEGGLPLDESCVERRAPDCELCGRSPLRQIDNPPPLKLRKGTSSLEHDLFRVANFMTKLIASEGFVSFCKEHSFSNIEFEPVELV
jgi:hypothetical protein